MVRILLRRNKVTNAYNLCLPQAGLGHRQDRPPHRATGDVYKHFAGGISGVLRADVEAKILTEIETEFLDDDDDGGGGGGEDEALEEAWRALNAIWRASLPPSVRYPASSALGA